MPEIALVIGKRWINRRIIQENNLFIWVTFIVLFDSASQRISNAG